MGRSFKQFTLEDRCEISRRSKAGESARQIAAALDCAPSSVTRELKRNAGVADYKPGYADAQAQARRWHGSRLLREPELQQRVLQGLAQGCSPEAVSGILAQSGTSISHESIYRFIHAQIVRTKDYGWRHYLPRGKSKRGLRGRRGGSSAIHIQNRVSIEKRSVKADDRIQAGHWEGDLKTRLTLILRQTSKAAAGIAQTLRELLEPLPERLRRTLTFDNGTEFSQHSLLREQLGIRTYFCDPHSPWQKGGIENAIGRLRRYLPRKTDLDTLTPRKCLGYKTPAQAMSKVLHFNCESTDPHPRE